MRSLLLLAAALFAAGCASKPAPPAPRSTTPQTFVALLPKADGSAGAVNVTRADSSVLLNTAYGAARTSGTDGLEPARTDAAEVRRRFGPALDALPPRPVSHTLFFIEGRDEFTPESRATLESVLKDVASRPAPDVAVTGHTDSMGSDRFNDELSLRRARRVAGELVRLGVPKQFITVAGRGSRDPLPNAHRNGPEPRNRRVEITAR
jgi:outer membrane protein OmpA-like peptidoglycan-associated protein